MEYKTTVHRWTTKSEYYDVETGEEISKKNAVSNYDILKKFKTYKIDHEKNQGTIIWNNECARKRQTKLW